MKIIKILIFFSVIPFIFMIIWNSLILLLNTPYLSTMNYVMAFIINVVSFIYFGYRNWDRIINGD